MQRSGTMQCIFFPLRSARLATAVLLLTAFTMRQHTHMRICHSTMGKNMDTYTPFGMKAPEKLQSQCIACTCRRNRVRPAKPMPN